MTSNSLLPGESIPVRTKRIRKTADARREEILEVARKVLSEEGYAAFSTREIARRCGIRVSTVAHHFPTRAALLEHLTTYVIEDYVALCAEALDNSEVSKDQRLLVLISMLLSQNERSDIMGFFYELWAFSHRDQTAADSLLRMEEFMVGVATKAAIDFNDRLTEQEARERSVLILAAIDGLGIMLGSRRRPPAELSPGFNNTLIEMLLGIAR